MSQENEVVRRRLWDWVDAIPVIRDDTAWTSYKAQISVGRQHGRMAGTQNEVEMLGASVFLMRDGRVARVDHYANRAEALEAVGLAE
jgi:ketosteroid isomerase-like protein